MKIQIEDKTYSSFLSFSLFKRTAIPTAFSGYTLDEYKDLDADAKKAYTCYLRELYNNDKNKLRKIANTSGFLILDCSTIEPIELEGFNLTTLYLQGCQNLTSLDGLEHLTNLTSLDLQSCHSLPSLEWLQHLTNLNYLHLSGCQNLTSLEGGQHLPNLTALSLQGGQNLTSFEGLEHLPNLTSLNLQGGQKLTSLEGLEHLPNLTYLHLQGGQKLTSLEVIERLTNLTSLTLHGCQNLTSLERLEHLTNLTSLTLQGCQNLKSLKGLEPLPNLTSLTLQGGQNLTSLKGLEHLSNLTALFLQGGQNLTSLKALEHLSNLISLSLYCCQNLTSLEELEHLPNLTTLHLQGGQNLTSLKGLRNITNLTSLSLYGCQTLTSLEGLEHLTNLTSLNLQSCHSLPSLEWLQHLTNLNSFNLSGYQHPIDLSLCPSLKKLHLDGCPKGPSISENLNKLEVCQVVNSCFPINPFLDKLLLRAPNLEFISFIGKSHTYSEYARLLGALSRIKNEPSFSPQKTLLNRILQDIHATPFILPMDDSMVLYHVYLLLLLVGDSLSDEQKGTLTTCFNDRLADRTKPLDLLGIWSLHRMGPQLGVEFDLSTYADTFTSELRELELKESHQLHEILGSNSELERHIETLSAGQVESSDLQDQLTRDGVFSGIETKLKNSGVTATITQEELEKGHRLDIVVEITDASGLRKKINIELDGGHHETPYQKTKEVARDGVLRGAGYAVIRISNRELSRPAMKADDKIDFIIDVLKPLFPELSDSEVRPGGGSSRVERSDRPGGQPRGGRRAKHFDGPCHAGRRP